MVQIKKSSEQAKKTENESKPNRAQSKENCDIFIFAKVWLEVFRVNFGDREGRALYFFFLGPKLLRKLTGNCLAGRTDIAMCVCVLRYWGGRGHATGRWG